MLNHITLLKRAEVDFETTAMLLRKATGDEVFLDAAAYHVQQGIEKCLKFQIQLCGGVFPYTHDTGKLINALDLLGQKVPQWIVDNQTVLDSYATSTRYGTSVVGTVRKIQELLDFGNGFVKDLKENHKDSPFTPSKSFTDAE